MYVTQVQKDIFAVMQHGTTKISGSIQCLIWLNDQQFAVFNCIDFCIATAIWFVVGLALKTYDDDDDDEQSACMVHLITRCKMQPICNITKKPAGRLQR